MSKADARTSRCSASRAAIHRAIAFNTRTLACSDAFLDETRKGAWHKGFCDAIVDASRAQDANVAKKFDRDRVRARRSARQIPATNFFLHSRVPKARRSSESIGTRANRYEVIRSSHASRHAIGTARDRFCHDRRGDSAPQHARATSAHSARGRRVQARRLPRRATMSAAAEDAPGGRPGDARRRFMGRASCAQNGGDPNQ